MGHITKAVVVGAGISGLACAYRLEELGITPLVLEASGAPGGILRTVRRNGFVFEGGPQFPRFPEPVWRLVRALELDSEFLAGDSKAKRYILRDGRLHLAPFSAGSLLRTSLVGLKSKSLILSEVLRRSHPPATEETLAEFVERKFGSEVLDYLVDPIISTVFFGDANDMGMGSAFPSLVEWERQSGSLARGAIHSFRSKLVASKKPSTAHSARIAVTDALPTLGTFRSGMATLPEKLAARLQAKISYERKVESVTLEQEGNATTPPGWRLRLATGHDIRADAVVLATPAHVAAPLLQEYCPKLASLLGEIMHAALGVVSCAYQRNQVHHTLDGFGLMIPRREGFKTICTFWNSSLFPMHAPDGMVLLTSYVRAKSEPSIAFPSDNALAQSVHSENAKILGITGEPLDYMVWKYPRALPQYTTGHTQRVSRIRELLSQAPGLYLAGNYLNGRSIGDCATTGFRAAEDVHSHFEVPASNYAAFSGDR